MFKPLTYFWYFSYKKKYSSVEDFFYKITKNQFETEKFISDLSKKYNFPYEKNSIIAKFLSDNHDKFKNNWFFK